MDVKKFQFFSLWKYREGRFGATFAVRQYGGSKAFLLLHRWSYYHSFSIILVRDIKNYPSSLYLSNKYSKNKVWTMSGQEVRRYVYVSINLPRIEKLITPLLYRLRNSRLSWKKLVHGWIDTSNKNMGQMLQSRFENYRTRNSWAIWRTGSLHNYESRKYQNASLAKTRTFYVSLAYIIHITCLLTHVLRGLD